MRARRIAASVLLSAGLVVVSADAASAAPTNCTVHTSGNQASSLCTAGTGEHRIYVLQRHFMPGVGPVGPFIGPWQPVGTASVTQMGYHEIVRLEVETRG
ncbi:hypothetical protein [Rhizohabitans arisaemae]|uniref:hypothetical protein n=1 Tax=Rhizohabitans arisaemae TaxID=2720610 RepID=UPI0024B1537A|nr:hypothetical protein [Rhizohabitans arisaemae]